MMIVNCQNIKAYHGAQLVLEDVNLDIQQGERIGLIGRNGSGKSTLLQLIAGLLRPDAGQLTVRKGTRIGYLTQIPAEFEGRTVYDVLALGHRELLEYRLKMAELEKLMSEPGASDGPDRLAGWLEQYAALQEKFEREGGYELDAVIERVADGLRIDRSSYAQTYATLSGGEKTRINLASQLIRKPELLLLDEPTNHLDLHGVEWLEDYLTQYDGSCLIVSHDRYFLDRVVTKIVELEDGESQSYFTNYTGYMKEKEARLLQQFADYQEQQKKIKKMMETIKQLETWGRIGDNGKFFRRAASMQKALDRMEKLKRPVLEAKSADFGLTQADRSGRKVVTLEGIGKSYGGRKLLDAVDGALAYGDKVVLIGKNGSGKSTLVKLILGEEAVDEGALRMGRARGHRLFGPAGVPGWAEEIGAGLLSQRSRSGGRGGPRDSGQIFVLRPGRVQVGQSAVGRGVDAAEAGAAGASQAEPAAARRADEPPGHRLAGSAGGSAGDIPGHRARHLARPLFYQPAGRAHLGAGPWQDHRLSGQLRRVSGEAEAARRLGRSERGSRLSCDREGQSCCSGRGAEQDERARESAGPRAGTRHAGAVHCPSGRAACRLGCRHAGAGGGYGRSFA